MDLNNAKVQQKVQQKVQHCSFEEQTIILLQDWCCRFKEEAEKYNTTEKLKLQLIPTRREFSKYPEIEGC